MAHQHDHSRPDTISSRLRQHGLHNLDPELFADIAETERVVQAKFVHASRNNKTERMIQHVLRGIGIALLVFGTIITWTWIASGKYREIQTAIEDIPKLRQDLAETNKRASDLTAVVERLMLEIHETRKRVEGVDRGRQTPAFAREEQFSAAKGGGS